MSSSIVFKDFTTVLRVLLDDSQFRMIIIYPTSSPFNLSFFWLAVPHKHQVDGGCVLTTRCVPDVTILGTFGSMKLKTSTSRKKWFQKDVWSSLKFQQQLLLIHTLTSLFANLTMFICRKRLTLRDKGVLTVKY